MQPRVERAWATGICVRDTTERRGRADSTSVFGTTEGVKFLRSAPLYEATTTG